MFEASVDGQLYDPERFATYYRPYGMDAPANTGNVAPAPTAATAPAPVAEPVAAPVAETTTDTGWQDPKPEATPAPTPTPEPATAGGDEQPSAQDILAMIRQRKES